MSDFSKYGRAFFAALAVVFYVVVIATIGFTVEGVYCAAVCLGDWRKFRNRFTWHTLGHGSLLFLLIQKIMRINMRIELPTGFDPAALEGQPMLVISNHLGLIDTLLLCVVQWRFGLTRARWILKQEVWWIFPIAMAAYVTKCAFVKRMKGSGDLLTVAECAALAFSEGACLLFFPEGGRFKGSSPEAKYHFVADPKLGGWKTALERMPTASVLSLTLHWSGAKPGEPLGRTFSEAMFAFLDGQLAIKVEHIDRNVVDADPNWLEHHWATKEETLKQAWKAETGFGQPQVGI